MDQERESKVATISFHIRLEDVPDFLHGMAEKAEDIIDSVGADMCTQKQHLHHKYAGREFFTDEVEAWSEKLKYAIVLLDDIKRLSESLTELKKESDGFSTSSEEQSKPAE